MAKKTPNSLQDMRKYLPIIAAIQKGARDAGEIIKAAGAPESSGYSRLARLRQVGVVSIKNDGYIVNPKHILTEEQIQQIGDAPEGTVVGDHPELRRIEQRLLALVDEVRALSSLIVSPQDRMAIEAMRKAGVRLKA